MSRRQSGSYASSPVSASPIQRGSRKPSAALVEDDDEGLVMREKDREGQNGSIGKSGGVDVGVTRPKRRLSR
jgi:UDP-sugar transporter A1/2/3